MLSLDTGFKLKFFPRSVLKDGFLFSGEQQR